MNQASALRKLFLMNINPAIPGLTDRKNYFFFAAGAAAFAGAPLCLQQGQHPWHQLPEQRL